jgi:thioredoxin-related protein
MGYRCVWMAAWALVLTSAAWAASKRPAPAATPWVTNYDQAVKLAEGSKRPILACFLGSDWCPYCIRLLKEVLTTADFRAWSATNVVVLVVDSPKNSQLPPALKAQNQALREKFSVKGLPTCVLIAADSSELGRVGGYESRESWQKSLQKLMTKDHK